MTPKEYLQQYRICCRKHSATIESIEQLRSIAEKTTQALTGDRVSSSASDRIGNIATILADAETEAFTELEALVAKKKEIMQAVKNVEDDRFRELLEYKYIIGLELFEVALKIGYCYDYTRELHGKALLTVKVPTQTHINM